MEPENLSQNPIASEKDVAKIETPDMQISELKDLTRSLILSIQEMKTQQARSSVFDETVANLNAASRAMLQPIASAVPKPAYSDRNDCGSKPESCISEDCCCFEIVLSKVRASKPQLELPDIGDVPLLINALETQIYVTVNNIGFIWPGLSSTMELRANGIPGGPGPWVTIERVINTVTVKRGTTKTIVLNAEVRELDEGAERPLAFKDELGEGSGIITLDCCMTKIYPDMPIDVNLIHGGDGNGQVQIVYYAQKVCC